MDVLSMDSVRKPITRLCSRVSKTKGHKYNNGKEASMISISCHCHKASLSEKNSINRTFKYSNSTSEKTFQR